MHPTVALLQNNIELDCDGFEFLAKSPHTSLRRLANTITAQWDDGFVPVFLEHWTESPLILIFNGRSMSSTLTGTFLDLQISQNKPTRTYHYIFYSKKNLRALPSDGKSNAGNKTARPFPVSVMPPSEWAAPCCSTRALVRDATHLTLLHISSYYFIISHESSQRLLWVHTPCRRGCLWPQCSPPLALQSQRIDGPRVGCENPHKLLWSLPTITCKSMQFKGRTII